MLLTYAVMRRFRSLRRIPTWLTILMLVGTGGAGAVDSSSQVAWLRDVDLDGRNAMLGAAAFDEAASELVIAVRTFASTATVEGASLEKTASSLIVRLDAQGKLIATWPLEGRLEGAGVRALDVRLNGQVVMAVELADGQRGVAVLAPHGALVALWTWSSATPSSATEPMAVQRVLALTDGTILVAGVAGADGVVRRIDAQGKIVLERRVGALAAARDIDVIPGAGGGFFATVNTGDYEDPAYALGPARVIVVGFDARGRAVVEQAVDGRHGRLARTANGYGLLIDRSREVTQDWWLVQFDEAFQERARLRIHRSGAGLGNLSLLRWPGGGSLVLGASDGQLWRMVLDRDGREVALLASLSGGTAAGELREPIRGGFFHIIEAGPSAFALTQAARRSHGRMRTVIQVVRVVPQHEGRGAIQ